MLLSAMNRPVSKWDYETPRPDLCALAAAYAFGPAKNHPFLDGNGRVVRALDRAFYASFDNVASTGLRWMLAVDVSGSMRAGRKLTLVTTALAYLSEHLAATDYMRAFADQIRPFVPGTYKVLEEIPKELLGKPVQRFQQSLPRRLAACSVLEKDDVVRTVCGVLHLGNLKFQERKVQGVDQACEVENQAMLELVAYQLPPEVDYLLYVRTQDGRAERVGSWRSVDGKPMQLTAGTAATAEELESVEVRTADGRVVLRLAT